jgi:hypothetical protein
MGLLAVELAQVSALAFEAAPGADLAALGLQPLDFRQLHMSDGLFTHQNAAALVATGTVAGTQALVLAIRGSDDAVDWRHDFLNINADYPKFARLFAAVDIYAAVHDLKVIVTGFSLGGALAQEFMAHHHDLGDLTYQAITFGSPGALIAAGSDARITNYEIASDPLAFVGVHREEIAQAIAADPTGQLHDLFSAEVMSAGIPITQAQLDASLAASLVQGDYHNRGQTVELHTTPVSPDPTAITGISSLLDADPNVHDIGVYGALVAAAPDPALIPSPPGGPLPEWAEAYLTTHPHLTDALVNLAVDHGWGFV